MPDFNPRVESRDLGAAIERQLKRGLARRAGEGDLFALEELARLERVIREITTDAGTAAHFAGYTYAQLGEALGITKQSAHERFTVPGDRNDIDQPIDHGVKL
jgi:hypothetical protein